MHSPRAYHGLGIGYATAPRGACHNAANVYVLMGSVIYPELDLEGPFAEQSSEGKGAVSARAQDFAGVQNAAGLLHAEQHELHRDRRWPRRWRR